MATAPTHARLRLTGCAAGVVGLYAMSIALARSTVLAEAPDAVATGITLDLTVTAAALIYLLAVRPRLLPAWVLIPVVAGGLAAASIIVPDDRHDALRVLGYGWAVVEAGLAILVAMRLRLAVRAVRRRRAAGQARSQALREGLTEALGHRRLAAVLAHELSALSYAVVGWRRAPAADSTLVDRDAAMWSAIAAGLTVAIVGEGVAVHLWLRSVDPVWAAAVSCLHGYSLLWLLGDARALIHETSSLTGTDRQRWLRVRLGLRACADIPLSRIASVEPHDGAPPDEPGYLKAHLLGEPNLLVRLEAPVTAITAFGRERTIRIIGLAVRDVEAATTTLDVTNG